MIHLFYAQKSDASAAMHPGLVNFAEDEVLDQVGYIELSLDLTGRC